MSDSTDRIRDAAELKRRREAERLKSSLLDFLRHFWSVIEPDQPLVENWHIVELCAVLEGISEGKAHRLIINIPPGSMKSLLVSVIWPAWRWARNPKLRVLTAAYGAHLTTRDNLKVRDIVMSNQFQYLFNLQLVEDQNTKTRYNTSAGGWRIATSVGGVGTGEHPDLIIIDDAITADQANSEPERTAANRWFDRTISTRGASRGSSIVVIGQRLHEEDLPGYLLKRGGWIHVCWPMRYEPTRPATEDDPGHSADPRDHRTEAGELLFPDLFPETVVRQLELDLGPYGSAGQLQQRPSPEGGGLFKREWFKFLDVAPRNVARRVRGWDTAATEGKGDYTRGVRIAETHDDLVIVDDTVGGQWGPASVDSAMKTTADMDRCPQREEQEPGSAGKAVIAARAKLLKGHDYEGVTIGGDKVTRSKPFRSQVEAGNVYLVRGPWNEEYIRELCGFPTGKHDDYVDGSSCAYNALVQLPRRKRVSASWAED